MKPVTYFNKTKNILAHSHQHALRFFSKAIIQTNVDLFLIK